MPPHDYHGMPLNMAPASGRNTTVGREQEEKYEAGFKQDVTMPRAGTTHNYVVIIFWK